MTNAVSLLHELSPKCGVFKDTLIPVSTAVCCFLAVMKILSIRLHSDKMLEIITSIVEDWSSAASTDDLQIMNDAAQIGRRICFFQLISAFVSTLPMLLCGVGNSVTFDPTKNITEIVRAIPLANPCFYGDIFLAFYPEIYFLQILQIISTVVGNVGCDCYFFGITMHLVGQIQRFASDIENFQPQECELGNQQILRIVIKRHTHLIRMAEYLEKIFSVVIAFQVMANVYQISMGGTYTEDVIDHISKNSENRSALAYIHILY